MKGVYLLAAVVLIGIAIMLVCNYKVLGYMEAVKHSGSLPPESSLYITGSYLGLTLFLAGTVGAILLLLRNIGRRL